MHLEGSCHCGKIRFSVEAAEPVPFMRCYCTICRKTAGAGGYAINLGAAARSMQVTGKRDLRIYRASLPDPSGSGTHLSTARRYFCARCGSALWVWDPTWPELVHPHASAIDTPLPAPAEHVHCLVGSKAPWVSVEGRPDDARFEHYPDMSLAQWHRSKGLASPPAGDSNSGSTVMARRLAPGSRSRSAGSTEGQPASELIDQRIAELGDWRGETLGRMRSLIKEAAPEVIEEWKWRGTPVWSHDGIICTGESYKSIVKLTFAKGASLKDPARIFNSSLDGNARRAIDIHEGEMVDAGAFKALVRAAAALNTSTGKPGPRRAKQVLAVMINPER